MPGRVLSVFRDVGEVKKEGIEVGEGATCLGCRLVSCAADTPGCVVCFFGYEWRRTAVCGWIREGMRQVGRRWNEVALGEWNELMCEKMSWMCEQSELRGWCFKLSMRIKWARWCEWNELDWWVKWAKRRVWGRQHLPILRPQGQGGCKIPPIMVYKTYI